ncbi:hypothetical protein ACGFXC_10420 [Streptomyces sp. NPDC048507]|uniref:hypothetical protein n=1 Tax=Streptomyces sp. NPDC048507 TaxID=3365560 RepID=UPI00372028A8
MPRTISFRPDKDGMRKILTSEDVRKDLLRRAEKIADRVRHTTDTGVFSRAPGGIIADSYTGRERAGATVIGVPLAYEADHRPLGAAVDAARD